MRRYLKTVSLMGLFAFVAALGALGTDATSPPAAFAQASSCQTECCEDIEIWFHASGDAGGQDITWRRQPEGATIDVTISNSGFVPSSIVVNSGDLVRFTNQGAGPHGAIGSSGSGAGPWDVGTLMPGESGLVGPFGAINLYNIHDPFASNTATLEVTGDFATIERIIPVRFEVRYCASQAQTGCRTYGGTISADGQLIPDPGWPQPVSCTSSAANGGMTLPPMAQMLELFFTQANPGGHCSNTTTNYPDFMCFVDSDYIVRIARRIEGGLQFPHPLCFKDFKVWVDQSAELDLSQRLASDPCSAPDRLTLLPESIQKQSALLVTALDIALYECRPSLYDSAGSLLSRGGQGPGEQDGICLDGLFQ